MAQNLAGPQGSKSRCSQAFGQSHQAIPSRVSTLGHRPSKPTPDSVADAICRWPADEPLAAIIGHNAQTPSACSLLARPTEPAHRFDTAGMVSWALERTPGVWFRHDYLGGHDATIAMVKLEA